MGGHCDKYYPPPDPDVSNHCSDFGTYYYLPNFCAKSGNAGKNYRVSWCDKIGDDGEWYPKSTGGSDIHRNCTYDSCEPYRAFDTYCCSGCCGTYGGSGVDCQRKKFAGDSVVCCLKDLNFVNKPIYVRNPANTVGIDAGPGIAGCYSDTAMKRTCSPCNRDITTYDGGKVDGSDYNCGTYGNDSCRDAMYDYCSGADLLDPNDLSWMTRWTGTPPESEGIVDQPCVYALKRNLYPSVTYDVISNMNPIGTAGTCAPVLQGIPLSTSGTVWSQGLMNAVFTKYAENGFYIGAIPGTVGYNEFQEFLYELCCAYPIICQDGLNSTCSMYSAQRLTTNANIAGWCGCYLPEAEYTTYINNYQINKECTPMCNRVSTIPMVYGDGSPISCTQSVCMIDNNTIGLANSTVNGGINFNQVCGNCGEDASCTCIVSGNTVEGAGASIGGGINLNNYCGSTQCSVPNPNGGSPSVLTVPCDQMNDPDSAFSQQLALYYAEQAAIKRDQIITVLIVIFIALVIIIIAFFLIRPNWKDAVEKDVTLKQKTKKLTGAEAPKIVSMPSSTSEPTIQQSSFKIGTSSMSEAPGFSSSSSIGGESLSLY